MVIVLSVMGKFLVNVYVCVCNYCQWKYIFKYKQCNCVCFLCVFVWLFFIIFFGFIVFFGNIDVWCDSYEGSNLYFYNYEFCVFG